MTNARLLLEVALRVLGFGFFFISVSRLTMTASLLWAPPAVVSASYMAASVTNSILHVLLGGALICWAPGLAARFYPSDPEGVEARVTVGPGDAYRIACFVLGTYLLACTAEPVGRLIAGGMTGSGHPSSLAADTIATTIYAISGVLLVFGSRRIAELLSHLRYDPDAVPQQQISIAMLLILMVILAVILGILRRVSGAPL